MGLIRSMQRLTPARLNALAALIAVKTLDTAIVADTSLDPDPHLTVNLAASVDYGYEIVLNYGPSAGRLKVFVDSPTGATGSLVGVDDTAAFFSALDTDLNFTPTTGVRVARMSGRVLTAGAGAFRLLIAQVSASGTTTVYAGSSLRAWRINAG